MCICKSNSFISSCVPPQGAFSLVIEARYSPAADIPGGEEMCTACPPLEGDTPCVASMTSLFHISLITLILNVLANASGIFHVMVACLLGCLMSHTTILHNQIFNNNCTSFVLFLACMGKCTVLSENMKPCQKSQDSLFLDFTPFFVRSFITRDSL